MKNILILILSLLTICGYSQTQINTANSNSVANINTAIKGSITATGTNTYVATMSGFTWGSGDAMDITFVNANSGASTFNLNGAGALTLKKESSGSLVDLVSGDIIAGARKRFYHNGTYLVMQSSSAPDLSGYQPLDSDLTTIAGLSPSNDDFLQRKSGAWTNRTVAQVKTDLGLSGTNTGDQTISLTGDVTGSGTGSFAATIASGVIVDADVNASAAIAGTKIANTPAGNISATTSQAAINELDAEKVSTTLTRNTQTTNYTLVLTDNFKSIEMNSASATVVTVPPNSSVAFTVDATQIIIKGKGAGSVTISPGSGVTINSYNNQLVLSGQFAYATLIKIGTNEWDLVGNLKP